MPALITHYLFGEEVLSRGLLPDLDNTAPADDPRQIAYLVGCQGPDPFFFRVRTGRLVPVRSMGSAMHRSYMSSAFEQMRSDVALLPADDAEIGRAFTCGVLAHYALDRIAHPFIYCHEFELCDNSKGLHTAHHEVLAVIESEIDCGILDLYRHCSVADFPPVSVLEENDHAAAIAGGLIARLGHTVYGLPLRSGDYGAALNDMRMVYRNIEPYGSREVRVLGDIERVLHGHSILQSLAHRTDQGADNPSMNLEHDTWQDPFKGATSSASVPELFESALDDYALLVPQFLNGAPMSELTHHIDYGGRLLGADEARAPK